MNRVKIAELKDHLSEHLRAVERGAVVIVTDRDRPIARISPMSANGRGASLEPPKRAFPEIRDRVREPAGWAIGSLEILLEERGDR
jgi:prevent-host-death family protein